MFRGSEVRVHGFTGSEVPGSLVRQLGHPLNPGELPNLNPRTSEPEHLNPEPLNH